MVVLQSAVLSDVLSKGVAARMRERNESKSSSKGKGGSTARSILRKALLVCYCTFAVGSSSGFDSFAPLTTRARTKNRRADSCMQETEVENKDTNVGGGKDRPTRNKRRTYTTNKHKHKRKEMGEQG